MESIMTTTLLVVTVFVLEMKGLQAQDTSNVCDTDKECSCCASEDACLSSHLECDRCRTYFANYTCLGPCYEYNCLYVSVCYSGYCRLPCKDGYWGARCIMKCPANCISCNQEYKKTYECFKCAAGTYGENCTKSCPVNCFNGMCEKTNGLCLNCSSGYYGNSCSDECPASCDNGLCEKTTGACLSCKSGYYGNSCSDECPASCDNGLCEKTTGACLSCRSGYYGNSCSDECPASCDNGLCEKTTGACLSCKSGYYGNSCSDECPASCDNGLCEKTTGACLSCKLGYYGNSCFDECPAKCDNGFCEKTTGACLSCKSGYYGNRCSDECPANCDNGICNKTTGACFSCENGYYGYSCSENCSKFCRQSCAKSSGYCERCADGYYGNMCEVQCPSNCITNFCFQSNGTCSNGCKPNFQGDMCTSCKPGNYGKECSQSCSTGCKNDVCEKEQGSCTYGCKDGFSDSQYCCTNNTYCDMCATTFTCRMCTNSTYGYKCQFYCPLKCNGTCDMLTGKCTSCLVGYHGIQCDNDCNKLCRYSICDMEDGQCTHGCINDSSLGGCMEDVSQIIPGAGRSATTGIVAGLGVIILFVVGIVSTYFIRRRIRKRSKEAIVAQTYDSLQVNLRNTDSAYASYAPPRCSEDVNEHVYINTALQKDQIGI